MLHIKTIEGQLQAQDIKFTIIASRFNDFIVDRLIGGAVDYLVRHGAARENIELIRVPGAFEMPIVASASANFTSPWMLRLPAPTTRTGPPPSAPAARK